MASVVAGTVFALGITVCPTAAQPTPVNAPTIAFAESPLFWMIFPANPPPLGVLMPRGMQPPPSLSASARALSGEMLEPYFANLSTYRVQPWLVLDRTLASMLADYGTRRTELVAELRQTIAEVSDASAEERLAAFSRLAAGQESRLAALENTGEILRAKLALKLDWNGKREWHLHAGDLKAPHQRTTVLEYLVVRAAAFHVPDLTPAQRRLLREAARLMEDELFAEDASLSEQFQFFSPDLMLLQFPANLPAGIKEDIALHAARKEELRQELRDVIYRTDGGLGRGSALRHLASEQHPRIEALEDLAEKIRRDLANHDRSWRRSPPAALPAGIAARLAAFLATRQHLQDAYHATIEPIVSTPPSAEVRANEKALHAWREAFHERLAATTEDFQREFAAETVQLEELAVALDAMLGQYYAAADVGNSATTSLLNFLHRRRVETAYHEYDIAAFEPGLSPRQRLLLFAAAVAALDLPLPAPERQPVEKPETVIK